MRSCCRQMQRVGVSAFYRRLRFCDGFRVTPKEFNETVENCPRVCVSRLVFAAYANFHWLVWWGPNFQHVMVCLPYRAGGMFAFCHEFGPLLILFGFPIVTLPITGFAVKGRSPCQLRHIPPPYPYHPYHITMASPSGNAGWAQLRQQARTLETQVGAFLILAVGTQSLTLLDGEPVSYVFPVLNSSQHSREADGRREQHRSQDSRIIRKGSFACAC